MKTKNDNIATACLRGSGQVFFMENALTGILFLIAIAYASYDGGTWATTIGGVVGLIVATLTATVLGCDKASLNSGLYGFNGILLGIALPTFIASSPQLWFCVVFGAAFTTVVTATFGATLTKSWGIPGSTGPFVLVAWLMVAATYSFGSLHMISNAPKLASDYVAGTATIPNGIELLQIFFRNIAQVFLLGSEISGVIILIGIFIASVPAGIAAVAGSFIAIVVSLIMNPDPSSVLLGLYGFSAVLTAISISTVFLKTNGAVIIYGIIATVITVLMQGAFNVFVAPLGIPSFTAAFVLTLYLFIAPKKTFAPHPHTAVGEHLFKTK